MLQGGLATIIAEPPLPDPLPGPGAPLSHLTDLIGLISQADAIDYAQQHQLFQQLGAALRSVDPEERRGGQDVLERFASRQDLYADVDQASARSGRTPKSLRRLILHQKSLSPNCPNVTTPLNQKRSSKKSTNPATPPVWIFHHPAPSAATVISTRERSSIAERHAHG